MFYENPRFFVAGDCHIEEELTKEEILRISCEMGLPMWIRSASPCLASRISYGTQLAQELLCLIAEGEN